MDTDQLERIREKAYALAEGGGPNADQARRILSKLPKVNVGHDFRAESGDRPSRLPVHGELSGGDIGSELPPTSDEAAGLPNKMDEMPLPQRAAMAGMLPSSRREFLRGADDMITFGAGQRLAGKVGNALGDEPDVNLEATQGEDARNSPNARTVGRLAGAVAPGGTARVFRGAGSLVGRAVSPLAGAGAAGRTFAGVLGGAGANTIAVPAVAGAQAAVRGENPITDISNAFKDPMNPVVGGLLGLPIGIAAGIHGNKGQVGRDIRLAEQYGANPNPIGGARGGAFDSPLLSGVEGSTREAGAMARKASRGVMGGLQEEQAGLSREYGASKEAAREAGFMEGRIDPLFVREAAEKLMKGERLTGSQRAAVEAEVTGALDRHPTGMTLDDFNDFRAKLGDIFGTGPRDAAHPALDSLRQAAKRTVDETEMGPINERYHEGTKALDKKYDQLKLTRDTDPRVSEERVAGQILRRGENTPTAGIQEPAIEEFLQANPKYRPLFDSVSLLNAKERMALGLEGHGGSLYSRLHGIAHRNVEPLQVGAYRLGMGSEKAIPASSMAARLLLNGGSE